MTETILKSNPHRGDTFVIVSDYPSGREWEQTRDGYTRAEAVKDICEGQFEHAAKVICVNEREESYEDVSAEIAEACLDRIIAAYWPGHDPYIPNLVSEFCHAALRNWRAEVECVA